MLLISCVPEGWPSSAIHCDHIRTPPASIHHADAGGEMIGNPRPCGGQPLGIFCLATLHSTVTLTTVFIAISSVFFNLAPAHCRSEREKLQQFVVNCKHLTQDILDSITCWLNSLWLLDKLDNSIGRIASLAKVPAATRCSVLASWHDLTVVTTFGHYC